MSKQLVSGEYCLAGSDEVKRIWLGCFNSWHICVSIFHEDNFLQGKEYKVVIWDICTPIPDEQEYEYQWLIDGVVKCLEFFTEKELENFLHLKYQKIETSKRVR